MNVDWSDERHWSNAKVRHEYEHKLAENRRLSAEVERLHDDVRLLHAALQDVVSSTGGGRLIVQDYGRLNQALNVALAGTTEAKD